MILKDIDPITSGDPLIKAGHQAETQMAFYLRRAFAESPNIRVFNSVRLERNSDAAQIDHLILHRFGMIIVESKSVTSRVQINEREEWTRWWSGRPKGMPSPVLQAIRQADFLRSYLEASADQLLGKALGLIQAHFNSMPVDVLVAISDDGIIQQPKNSVQTAVSKADQVPDRIQSLIGGHKQAASLFSLSTKGGYQFSEIEVGRISEFLVAEHRPLTAGITPKCTGSSSTKTENNRGAIQSVLPSDSTSSVKTSDASGHVCRVCQSENVVIEYGRFGYYFKCQGCDGNTPIKALCAGCGEKPRIRKSGLQFFTECEQCRRSDLFHVNGEDSVAAVRGR